MKKWALKNGLIQAFAMIAIFYGGTFLGMSLLIALAK